MNEVTEERMPFVKDITEDDTDGEGKCSDKTVLASVHNNDQERPCLCGVGKRVDRVLMAGGVC